MLSFLDCFATGRGNNRTGWSDPKFDDLLSRAQAEPNPTTRLRILEQAEEILVNQAMPIIPLYHFVGGLISAP